MTDFFAEINGHQVVNVSRMTSQGAGSEVPVCLTCGAHFATRREIEATICPAAGGARGHDLVTDPGTGLLYCTRCPLVAYDQLDARSSPTCPMPLQSWADLED
ncbi:hypothetical protein E1218_19580 [Kribbella turkmenica]|uniref:Uncharacterized protein n=1 Tax=Kribbella turkmenica TaxID=2530375 RepID=A0A4R4WWZ8_9ACTN|nr:hypothetical protein [Kribbella turkmenica]TDD22304.1 hypothetical protein E1218_19580 [Kribbella turkmenica]